MSDDRKQYEATPAATLEQRVMDPRIEKSETEWWAHREIERLRAALDAAERKGWRFVPPEEGEP